jgi:hypothetical protein
MITYTENVSGLKTETRDGYGAVVLAVSYYVYGTDGGVSSSRTVIVDLGEPNAETFISLGDLSLADALGWISDETKEGLKQEIEAEINNKATNVKFSDLPWNAAE